MTTLEQRIAALEAAWASEKSPPQGHRPPGVVIQDDAAVVGRRRVLDFAAPITVTDGSGKVILTVPAGSFAPADADYYVGTANANLSGEIAIGATATANKALMGPPSGAAATPAFRLLVPADLPIVGNWKVLYSNGSGVLTELALGADGTFFQGNGVSAAPTFAALVVGDLPGHGIAQHTEHANWKALYTDGSGDEQEVALGADKTYLRSTGTGAAPAFKVSPHGLSVHIKTPVAGLYGMFNTTLGAFTIQEVIAVTLGGTSATFNLLQYAQYQTASATKVWNSDKTVNASTTPTSYTSFDDATVPVDTCIFWQVVSVSGTPTDLILQFQGNFD